MKKRAFITLLSLLLALALPGAAFADAIVFPDDSVNVDYYVYVTTPDGGLNLREGPSVDYSIIMTIPDYELLHVTIEKSNGWGYVQYGDNYGWVYLGQTSFNLLSLGTAADYYVYVISPDGKLNLRVGPDTRCSILTDIEYGSHIHISRECAGWGLTSFDGHDGWVYLGETADTMSASSQTASPVTVSPSQRPVASPSPSPDVSPAPETTEQSQAGVKVQFTDNEEDTAPVPENSSALSSSTIVITALCAVIIILAALVIYFVLRRRS